MNLRDRDLVSIQEARELAARAAAAQKKFAPFSQAQVDAVVEACAKAAADSSELLARTAVERGCGRLDWAVLDWNTPSIGFYKSLGAVAVDEWTTFRLTGAALERLAGE